MNKAKSMTRHGLHPILKAMLLFLMLLPMQAFAQGIKVTGTVTDENNGEPIIGAAVKVKGSSTGTVTDIDGNYTINMQAGQTLEFSYVGYTTHEVKVSRAGTVNVRLSEDSHTLEQVVVVGYGTMKRSDLTGSVASIGEEQIKQGVNTSVEQAMQGRIAGVQVMQNSGAPGGGISVQIRGINSFNGNEPLYVVDGIAMSGQTSDNTSVLSSINPSDITSIEVLKDASATAIYGSRASNGVVLITTKRGQEGKPKLTYEGYAGWQQLPTRLEVMNLKEFARFYTVRAEIYGYGKREELLDESLLTKGTNWQDELFDTAFMHNHQVNVSGGTSNMHYSLSGGLLDQDGIGVGSNFSRASFRANFDTDVTKWLQVGVNMAYANTKQIITFDENNVISTALAQYPDMAPRNPDGSYDFGLNIEHNYNSNPLFEAEMRDNKRANQQLDYNVFANIKPLKGLTIRIEYGGNRSWGNYMYFQPNYQTAQQSIESQLTKTDSRNKYNSFKQYATYDFEPLQGHRLQIMAGHESQDGDWHQMGAGRRGYLFDTVKSLAVGDANFQSKCFNKLREIKSHGTTIVIVSHSLGQIEQICDRSIWIHEGLIKAEGPPKEIDLEYLDYMSRKMQDSNKKSGEAAEAEEPAGNEKGRRWGSGEARIKKIRSFASDGTEQSVFRVGEDIRLTVDYTVKKPVKDAVIGFGIFDMNGVQCYGTNTRIDKLPEMTLDKDGTAEITMKNVQLLSGEYMIDIAIEQGEGIPVDYYRQAYKIQMISAYGDAGIARVDHTWNLQR